MGDEPAAAADEPAASTEPPAASPVWLTQPDAPVPGERVRLRRRGPVAWQSTGPAFGSVGDDFEADLLPTAPVVARASRRVRILAPSGLAKLLLWVEREDLATVAQVDSAVALQPDAPPPAEVGAVLRPGAAVEVLERAAERVRVRFRTSEIELSGWVAARSLGQVFEPDERGMPGHPTHWLCAASAPLLDRPGGAVLAHIFSNEPDPDDGSCFGGAMIEVLEDGRSHRLVRYHHWGGVVVAGYLAAEHPLEELGEGGWGYGVGGIGGGTATASAVEIAAGACLHDARYGDEVGVATQRFVFAEGSAPQDRAWIEGTVRTNYHGDIPVWAFAESVREGRWRGCSGAE